MCKWDHIQGGSWIFAYCDQWMSVAETSRYAAGELPEYFTSILSQIISVEIAF